MGYKLNTMVLMLAAVLAAGQAAADVIVTSRYSKIEAFGAVNNEWVEEDSYDDLDETFSYGVFSDTVSGEATVTNHSLGFTASQTSGLTIDGGLLQEASASGDTSAYQFNGIGTPAGGGYGYGVSLFVIDFDVSDVPAPYHLLGAISSYGTPLDTFAELQLVNMNTLALIESWHVDGENIVGFDVSGMLSPGSYHLYVAAHSDSPGTFSNSAGYDVTLTVPEPSTVAMLGILGVCLGGCVWRKRRRARA
jgi:hypothetical protein